jgi:hypothetical protein
MMLMNLKIKFINMDFAIKSINTDKVIKEVSSIPYAEIIE